MISNIRINNSSIVKAFLGTTALKRIYSGLDIVYDYSDTPQPCFEVVTSISQASGDYVDVYVQPEQKWYKKNNLSQYEEYGVYETVNDLSTATYYSGKLVYYDTGNGIHQYKSVNGQWVDLGNAGTIEDVIWFDPAANNSLYEIGYYWGVGYKMVCNVYLSAAFSNDMGGFFNIQNKAPLEFNFYSNGFYLDLHDPTSTTSNSVYSGDYSQRLMQTGVLNNYHSSQVINFTLTYGTAKAELEDDGTLIGSWGTERTGQNWYNGLYQPKINITSGRPYHLSSIKVYNANNELVNDLYFVENSGQTGSQKLSMYDAVLDVKYDNTNSYTPNYHTVHKSVVSPIEEYDTKVAPANYVEYNTLAELEMMECPWYGMVAIIGGTDYYVYTEDGWTPAQPTSLPYLALTPTTANAAFTFSGSGLEYSINGGISWETLATGGTTPTIQVNNTILLRANFSSGNSSTGNGTITSPAVFKASGNIMSLVYGDNFVGQTSLSGKDYVFKSLFKNSGLGNVSDLIIPATTLSTGCYASLFEGNSNLVSVPSNLLPATTMESYAYQRIFADCVSLQYAPMLPATTLASYCYSSAFSSCSSLREFPALNATNLAPYCYSAMFNYSHISSIPSGYLPATTLQEGCYQNMFANSLSYLTSVPSDLLPATNVPSYAYNGMFINAYGLTVTPDFPFTTVGNYGCYQMFFGSRNLKTAKEIRATTLNTSSLQEMFKNCSSLVNITSELPALNVPSSAYMEMFRACSMLDNIPIIRATTVGSNGMRSMFNSCTSLVTINSDLPATNLSTNSYYGMFYNCSNLKKAPSILATNVAYSGSLSVIFYGCSKLNEIKAMFTTTPSSTYMSQWVQNVASSGTITLNSNIQWDPDNYRGVNGIPANWTVAYDTP